MNRKIKMFWMLVILLVSIFVFSGIAGANDFPNRPIRLIIPFRAGTSADLSSRIIASAAEKYLGVDIRVENIVGSAGVVGFTKLKNSEPDGYTIGHVTLNLPLFHYLGIIDYDQHDLQPIGLFTQDWVNIVVAMDAPWKNMQEFVEEAKENPGLLTMGSGSRGALGYITALAIQDATGIKCTMVPAPGGGASGMVSAAGRHIDSAVGSPLEALSQMGAGTLRSLAITSSERVEIEGFENVPTMKELGYDLVIGNSRAIFAPPGTPEEIVKILSEAIQQAVGDPDFISFCKNTAATPRYLSPEETLALYDKQIEQIAGIMERMEK